MDQEKIYAEHADDYDALVAAEDCEGRLLPAIERAARLDGASVLEVGVGTGRITRQLLPRVARLVGVDRSAAMLAVARRHIDAMPEAPRCELHCADARELPVADAWADAAVAGWVFGHFRIWMPDGWRTEIGRALAEMRRALVPGGALVIVETLGTGRVEPSPPTPALAEYFDWLETEQGMTREAIRTDYAFEDVAMAAAITGSFFGDDFAARVRREGWARVPECTGVWSTHA